MHRGQRQSRLIQVRGGAPLVAVVAGLLVACTPGSGPDGLEPVRVGVIVPLSGALEGLGPSWEKAAAMAAAEVNSAGGLYDGRLLELVVADSVTSPEDGRAAATRLIEEEGVVGIIGGAASVVTLQVGLVTSAAEVPQISCCSTSTDITTFSDGGFLFRTVPSDALQGKVLALHAMDVGYTSCAVFHTNDAYGLSLRDAFTAEFVAAGGVVEGEASFAVTETDMMDEVNLALSPTTTCGILIAYPDTGAAVISAQIAAGLAIGIQWFGSDGLKSDAFVNIAGAANVVGMLGTAPVSLGANFDNFVTSYTLRYSEAPVIFGENQYDATLLMALAISAARTTDGSVIRDALNTVSAGGDSYPPGDFSPMVAALRSGVNVDYAGASGPVDFDVNGDVLGNFEVWRIAGGGTFVQEDVISTAELQ